MRFHAIRCSLASQAQKWRPIASQCRVEVLAQTALLATYAAVCSAYAEGGAVNPRLNVVTLAVNDLTTSFDFYRDGLGLPGRIIGTEYLDSVSGAAGAVAFFELRGGLILALYPRNDFIKDANVSDAGGPSHVEFSLGYLTKSRREVDALIRQATAAGARVTEAPRERAWGIYSGYFSDPDGHLWEIIYNHPTPSRDGRAKRETKATRRAEGMARTARRGRQ